jgi:hypothetical protein
MARGQGEAASQPAVRGRKARCTAGKRRREAGQSLPGNRCLLKGQGFLSAAAEEKGISSLETDGDASHLSEADEEAVDFLLRKIMVAAPFSYGMEPAAFGAELEQIGVNETIVDDMIGTSEQIAGAESQKCRRSAACSD